MRPVVDRMLRTMLRRDEIEDAVQEVMARALKLCDQEFESPIAQVRGIAKNVCREFYRARGKRPSLTKNGIIGTTRDLPITHDLTPEEEVSTREFLILTQEAIHTLETKSRQALDHKLEGKRCSDAPRDSQATPAVLRKRLSRARIRLRSEILRRAKPRATSDIHLPAPLSS